MFCHHHHRGNFFIGGAFAFIFGIAIFSFIMGYPVMLLWNWLIPGLFGFVKITYMQGVGLFALGHLLTGSLFPGRAHRHFRHHHKHGPFSECSDDEEGWGKWRFYTKFWKEEGKAAFDAYVASKEQEKKAD